MVTKQVIIIRKDLKMRRGKEIAQGAHASMAVLTNNIIGYPFKWYLFPLFILKFIFLFLTHKSLRHWLTGNFKKICVIVESEQDLLSYYKIAKEKKVLCSLIKDSGLTEFGGVPTYTTVAIGPAESHLIDSITGNLRLY
jgi:PTH2 family peptidyl-tRNA hydrolase